MNESYPPTWWHCEIHLEPETGTMHSDGDHRVREWIEKKIKDITESRDILIKQNQKLTRELEHFKFLYYGLAQNAKGV